MAEHWSNIATRTPLQVILVQSPTYVNDIVERKPWTSEKSGELMTWQADKYGPAGLV